MTTRLAHILAEQKATYASVAREAGVQPRTLRQIATGETPLDSVQVGTVRRIAAALGVSPASLIDPETPKPGDPSLDRATRLSRAIADLMWSGAPVPYPTPVEHSADPLADVSPNDFFAEMSPIDARRG
jgi:transcriptional regulator with XRE-family HTH domain